MIATTASLVLSFSSFRVVAEFGLVALVVSLRKILVIAASGVPLSFCLPSFHVVAECGHGSS